jgi:uncharacterized membrane protein YbhN (UPF0104 family)
VKEIPRDVTYIVAALGLLVVAGAVTFGWVAMHKQGAHAVIREGRWAAVARHVVEGLQLMGNRRTLIRTALASLVYLFLQFLTVYMLMKADLMDYSFWVACGVLTIIRLATVVPNAPGNIGLENIACVAVLRLFDLRLDDAKTFSIILIFARTLPLLLGGAIATALTGSNIGELRDRARRGLSAQNPNPNPPAA